MLCGFPPFYHPKTSELYSLIRKGEFDFPAPYWTDVSDSAKDLIRKLLQVDPKKRWTAEQVLKHPWVQGSTAKAEALGSSLTLRLKLLQARRKLKRTVRSIMAINKFNHALDYHSGAGEKEK